MQLTIYCGLWKKEKFDLVQFATPNAAFCASIAANKARVPVRVYGQWGIRYVGFNRIRRLIFKFVEKIACKMSTHVFVASKKNLEFGVAEKLYDQTKASVIGNGGTIGVDLESFNLSMKKVWQKEIFDRHGFDKNDKILGFVGRITPDKGINELLKSYKLITEKQNNVKLLIIGAMDVTEGVDKDLFDWAQSNDSIVFTGRVNKSDLPKYYAALDVLVHPTYREGFGMVIQEAGAMAVPVITTDIPGASEVMVDQESCMLVPVKNQSRLQESIEELILSDNKRETLGTEAYNRTVKLFERNIMLKQQVEAYSALLER